MRESINGLRGYLQGACIVGICPATAVPALRTATARRKGRKEISGVVLAYLVQVEQGFGYCILRRMQAEEFLQDVLHRGFTGLGKIKGENLKHGYDLGKRKVSRGFP